MHFIYHDGTVKDVDTLDQMYMKKHQKQLVRIAFEPGWFLSIDQQTNKMFEMDVVSSMTWSGTGTQIVWDWEILDIFFNNYNIVPKWIEGNYEEPYYSESGEWTHGLITTVSYKIRNK